MGFKRLALVVVSVCWALGLRAQDTHYTQFFSVPLHYNPAFCGQTPHFRFATAYRNQWNGLLESNYAQFDYNVDYMNSGFGVAVGNDRARDLRMYQTSLRLYYAYRTAVNKNTALVFGMSGGYTQQNFNFQSLTFEDQLASAAPTQEQLGGIPDGYISFSSGALLYNRKFWLGLSLANLNQPKQYMSSNTTLPTRLSLQAGMKHEFKKGKKVTGSISPAFILQAQDQFARIDLGCNATYLPVTVGIWYSRLLNQQAATGAESVVAVYAGFQKKKMRIGYSFDYALGGTQTIRGMVHEIVLSIEPAKDRRYKGGKKGHRYIECPLY